ncbi:retrotransposon-related protein [Tanacetum coccineum]
MGLNPRRDSPYVMGIPMGSTIWALEARIDVAMAHSSWAWAQHGGGATHPNNAQVVGFNLDGNDTAGFRWITRNKLVASWDGFLDSVRNRFGPSKYEDPQGVLSKLLQLGTVAQYQSEFEKLMNRVTDISENLLISFYISGLKPTIQRELLIAKPTTLGDAFSLARITEARLEDQPPTSAPATKTIASVITQKQSTPRVTVTPPDTGKPPLLPTTTQTIATSKPLAIKWISPAERQERLNKRLCFNCDNK